MYDIHDKVGYSEIKYSFYQNYFMLMYEEKTEYVRVTSKFKASGRIYLMKLVEMSIVNYRQFKKADISFDDGITVLAGANNSGKTSLITLIKNVFNDEKNVYCESDIPAKNMQDWINRVYPIFERFFLADSVIEKIDEDLVEYILPKNEEVHPICIDTTRLRVHVSYNPEKDDIKLFADYIMDLDEDMHDFFFEYYYELKEQVAYYMRNAKVIYDGLKEAGCEVYGGVNAPYIWLVVPDGMTSWEFFDCLLNEAGVVGTPGSGFGPSGEGYFRLTAFGTYENTVEAVERIKNMPSLRK